MNKHDFLREAFKHRAYTKKEFLLSVLTINVNDPESNAILQKFPYAVWVESDRFYFNDHAGERTELEGDVKDPVFDMETHFDLEADFHPILRGTAMTTTFGIFLFNICLFYDALDGLLPYYNHELTKKFCSGIIRDIMHDDVPEGGAVPEGMAPVKKVLQISRNANYLEGILFYIVKCGSMDSLTVSKEVIALRDRLFKEHKDELTDPVVFNSIVERCVNLDYEIQMKGESATFYIGEDYITNNRKRMFVVFGIEFNQETGTWVPITKSLHEGWDINQLGDYINTAIEGAYNRGKATGEGGAGVKNTLRIMGSSHRSEDDCKTANCEDITIYQSTYKHWAGSWANINGVLLELNNNNLKKFIGKTIKIRMPQFCETKDGNYCLTCLGRSLGSYGSRLGSEASGVNTVFMLTRMKASHISGTSNGKVNLAMAFKKRKK